MKSFRSANIRISDAHLFLAREQLAQVRVPPSIVRLAGRAKTFAENSDGGVQLTVIDATDVNETFLQQLAHVGSLELVQFMIVAPSFEKQCAPL